MTFLTVWAVVRAGGLESGSFLTQLMTVTPYGAVLALLLAAALVRRNRPAAVVALVASLVMAAAVAPRAFPAGEPATAGTPYKVLAINLFGRADPRTVVELVRELRPDVFAATELTTRQVAALDAAGLDELVPHRVLQDEHDAAGSGLYGRHPLTELPGLFTPVGHNMPAAAMTLPGGRRVEVVAVHPNPPLGRMVDGWNRAMESFPAPGGDAIRILAGDFNASLDHRAMRDLLGRGYADAAHQAGAGLTPTWPNGRGLPPFITIDHILVDERAGVSSFDVLDVPGTDHRGVFAELRLPS
ncbi:endonuclease/exonuclease/phosphatase family protein [Nonomuraea sp. C10]|uniref:endonuclease/exonuclease/phosphatase family protein n=1 Tax=Nonomuraea sp. C10 TaxID=2600577 RepID=UPI00164FF171|nr:endonuclease/exonuclease/phosphatase family protein [Nonomuraea sp. C10]